jgi:hypothetical protein
MELRDGLWGPEDRVQQEHASRTNVSVSPTDFNLSHFLFHKNDKNIFLPSP